MIGERRDLFKEHKKLFKQTWFNKLIIRACYRLVYKKPFAHEGIQGYCRYWRKYYWKQFQYRYLLSMWAELKIKRLLNNLWR